MLKRFFLNLIPAAVLLTVVILLQTGIVLATTEGSSSGYDPVTTDSSITFTATLNNDGSVTTTWSKYAHAEAFTFYKVIRSSTNQSPVYPDDGYIYYDGNIDTLSYTDHEAPDGNSYYRVCQIASPKRYCSSTVVTITKSGTTGTSTSTDQPPVPTLYTETNSTGSPTSSEPAVTSVEMVPGFSDVPVTNFAADCIKNLAGKNIIVSGAVGESAVSFRPEETVNRAEFLKLVMTAYYPDVSKYNDQFCFKDVGPVAWYAPYICGAYSQDLVSGYTDGYYRPAKWITRAEGAAILVKSLHLPLETWENVPFTDVLFEWQQTVVAMAYKKSLINGYNQYQFGPNDFLTRAQAAKLICNAQSNFSVPLEGPVPVIKSSENTAPPSIITSSINRSAPLIINHLNTDLSKVPADYISSAKSFFRIAYGHTSHGSQLLTGMDLLPEKAGALYSYSSDGSGSSLYLNDSLLTGDLGGNWATQTRALLANNTNQINTVMWSWCGQLSSMTTEEVSTYLNTMAQLEKDFPGIVFIYFTGHLDGTGESGQLNKNNEQIRAFARNNNKVLFDFADIESYNPDGAYFLNLAATDGNDYSSGKNWASEWCAANSTSPLCASNSCAHSTSLNCNLKGRAVWWMLARLAGWEGV